MQKRKHRTTTLTLGVTIQPDCQKAEIDGKTDLRQWHGSLQLREPCSLTSQGTSQNGLEYLTLKPSTTQVLLREAPGGVQRSILDCLLVYQCPAKVATIP